MCGCFIPLLREHCLYPQKLHFQYVSNAHPKFSCLHCQEANILGNCLSYILLSIVFGGVGRRGVFETFQNFPENWYRVQIRPWETCMLLCSLNYFFMQSTKKVLNPVWFCPKFPWILWLFSCFSKSFMRSSSHTVDSPLHRIQWVPGF